MAERTAEQAYIEAYDNIRDLTDLVDEKAADLFARSWDSPDWGDVGDLNAIAEQLRQITEAS
jgi:hypothetical protein